MKFCTHCGKELLDEAVICPGCGCDCVPNMNFAYNSQYYNANTDEILLRELSTKVKTNGIIWLCIGILQSISIIFIIVGVLNIITAISDIKYSDALLKNPVGIVKRFEPMTGTIITLVYNLIFGGVIGVAGSLYYILGIRNFVMNNRAAFDAIEQKHIRGVK